MNLDIHEDKERNTNEAKKICENYNALMPSGLTLYFSADAFGLHYHHPDNDLKSNTGIRVSLNKPAGIFDFEANDACEIMHRYAKAVNKKYGRSNQKVSSVVECEKTMVDGKCQCGYSARASETALAARKMVKESYHTASSGKVFKSRLNDDGDIIW